MSKHRVLTYGIFRKGDETDNPLGKHIEQRVLHGFKMYTQGSFPYIIPNNGMYNRYSPIQESGGRDNVTVDIWEVTTDTIRYMDGVEGTPHHYTREIVSNLGFIYIPNVKDWDRVRKLERIEDGDFKAYRDRQHLEREQLQARNDYAMHGDLVEEA